MKKVSKVLMSCLSVSIAFAFASMAQAEQRYKPNNELIKPIEAAQVKNQAEVELGKKLFFDPRLSRSGFISCNSCHNLSMGGTDNLKTSIGDKWTQGPINSPTVLNSSLNFVQFWDGRAANLQEQAGGPIANPKEMAFSHDLAVDILSSIPQYRAEFKEVFKEDKITIEQITKALASFEETLVTPNSRFDKWLKGDEKAINDQELRGYLLFKNSGCVACHNGVAVGGNSFQKMGVMEPYVTDNELTYPYFHDGAANTLSEAVETMGRLQLGRKFTKEEVKDIVAFLKTLTGEQPKFNLPILPPSSDETPRANPWAK